MQLSLNFKQRGPNQIGTSASLRSCTGKSKIISQNFSRTMPQTSILYDKKHKKQTTDFKAFKQKENISDLDPPISCFTLINNPQPKLFISLDDLNKLDFPILSYTTTELIGFSKLIIDANLERRHIGKSFNLIRLIELIAENYNVNAYHNFSHAFSVMLLLYQSYIRSDSLRKMISEKQWFYIFLAALAHDINHPGTNNAFEIKKRSHLALEADNVSVLQKMHLSVFWSILKKNSQVNFLQGYTSYQSENIRQLITRMILSTDVASHFKNLDNLKKINSFGQLHGEQAMVFMENIFHACDIGNPCLDFKTYMNWGALVSYEFTKIAQKEQQLGLEVNQFLKYGGLTKYYGGQIGFCNGLVLPLWKELANIQPDLAEMRDNIILNIEELKRRKEEDNNDL